MSLFVCTCICVFMLIPLPPSTDESRLFHDENTSAFPQLAGGVGHVTVSTDNIVMKILSTHGTALVCMQCGTVTFWVASVITPRQQHRQIRNRGRGEVFHLRLDQRTLQLWGGFGAHVCQLGWISLPAESHGLLLQSVMKGPFPLCGALSDGLFVPQLD